ncbi:MAG: hypothetical protein G01um101470_263 [Parcubacteria group bacterium Gr01-1014_70]|nr:MAG: hypothetical protein G01um101470_263 [Parcubacteria group bacterium Gr01-1014_70]
MEQTVLTNHQQTVLKLVAKVRRVEALPRMIKPLDKDELRRFFTEEVKKLSPSIFL